MFYRSVFHKNQFRNLSAFYLHSTIRTFAVALFQIFSSIYIYQTLLSYGASPPKALGLTAMFFALVFLFQAVATIPTIWLISKMGLRFSVFWGNIILVAFFILLDLAKIDPLYFILAAVLGGIQIGLYWTAYHIYFTELTDDKRQGEEIALGSAIASVAAVGAPAFGGLLITYAGFNSLFLAVAILVLLANLPLKHLPKDKNLIQVKVPQVLKILTSKKERIGYLSVGSVGIVDSIAVDLWPVFVFPFLSGFIYVGLMGSLIGLVSMMTTILTGYLIDRFGAKKFLSYISTLDCVSWILKIFIASPIHVFTLAGIQAYTIAGQMMGVDSMLYSKARHQSIVAFVIEREMSYSVGKTIFLFTAGSLLWLGFPLTVIFASAAVFALLTRFYPQFRPIK